MPREVSPFWEAEWQGALWTPVLYRGSSLRFWFDASDVSTISTASNAVTDWRDKSGLGNHLTQATSGRRPTYRPTSGLLRGLPGIYFDGATGASAKNLQRTSSLNGFAAGDIFQLFCVAQLDSSPSTDSNAIIQFNKATITTDDYAESGLFPIPFHRHGTTNAIAGYFFSNFRGSVAISLNTPLILSNENSSTSYAIWVNGGPTTTASGITWPTTAAIGQVSVGTQLQDAVLRSWAGPICELLCVVRGQGAAGAIPVWERQRVEGYLGWKWGLQHQLPASHPFRNEPPLIGN